MQQLVRIFYPLFLSELAPELNTKVVPNFIVEILTKFQLKRISIAGDNRKLQKLCFLKNRKTRGGVMNFSTNLLWDYEFALTTKVVVHEII